MGCYKDEGKDDEHFPLGAIRYAEGGQEFVLASRTHSPGESPTPCCYARTSATCHSSTDIASPVPDRKTA